MSKWHYDYMEEIICKDSKDPRAGKYMAYNQDAFDYIINDNSWVAANNAFDEQSYIMDHLDMMLESSDGETVYIPCGIVAAKIELEREMIDSLQGDEIETFYK